MKYHFVKAYGPFGGTDPHIRNLSDVNIHATVTLPPY